MSAYRVGTAGWSYEDWEGIVYPVSKGRGFHPLSYLAAYIDIVEINSTYYRPAAPGTALAWLKRVEDRPGFLFAVKLHQSFTHGQRSAAGKDVEEFKRALDVLALRGRLAALLVQFPWSFRNTPANAAYVAGLLETFSAYPRAVEVRHASWDSPRFFDLLRERGAAYCNIDQPLIGDSIGPSSVSTTAAFAYVRLHGRNRRNWFRKDAGRDDRYDYLYGRDELGDWVRRIKDLGSKSGQVYVITNNHYRGQAMANALQIRNMITGRKVDVPGTLLNRYPALREIVSGLRKGQMDLFDKTRGQGGTGPSGGTS